MSTMGKGAGYYLTRSKSLLIDTAIVAILAIFMSFAMQMDALQSKGEDYLVLMLYAVIFGLTSLQSGAMIVDLTAKDKVSRRIEFFAASGIAVKEIIKQYSIQIFRFSGIIPFFVFMSCYYFTDWTMSFGRIVCVYLRFLYKGIIIKHNKTEPTYTKTSLFLCEKRRFFMARTEKGVVATI